LKGSKQISRTNSAALFVVTFLKYSGQAGPGRAGPVLG